MIRGEHKSFGEGRGWERLRIAAYLQFLASMIRGEHKSFGEGRGWERLRIAAYLQVLAGAIGGEHKSFGEGRGWEWLRIAGDLKDRGGHCGHHSWPAQDSSRAGMGPGAAMGWAIGKTHGRERAAGEREFTTQSGAIGL
jgi:hypothetical protein